MILKKEPFSVEIIQGEVIVVGWLFPWWVCTLPHPLENGQVI